MEGATGVVSYSQVSFDQSEYADGRKLITNDVNAAIDGAFLGGATEVLVNDAHGKMKNIIIEDLDPRARLIRGSAKHLCQMAGIDSSFDAAFLVGYHAMDGTRDGIIDHSLSSVVATSIRINGKTCGETGISASIASHFGVPVVLVTGDDKVCEEARKSLGDIETACVKRGMHRFVAECLPPKETSELIRQSACRAVRRAKEITPQPIQCPVTCEIDLKTKSSIEYATLFPEVQIVAGNTLRFEAVDMLQAFKMLWGTLLLGGIAADPKR